MLYIFLYNSHVQNASDIESYFSDIKKGMEEMSQDLESVGAKNSNSTASLILIIPSFNSTVGKQHLSQSIDASRKMTPFFSNK